MIEETKSSNKLDSKWNTNNLKEAWIFPFTSRVGGEYLQYGWTPAILMWSLKEETLEI